MQGMAGASGDENAKGTATVEEVKKHLIDNEKVPEKAIAIATGDQREIDGVDLFAKDCPIEVIITMVICRMTPKRPGTMLNWVMPSGL